MHRHVAVHCVHMGWDGWLLWSSFLMRRRHVGNVARWWLCNRSGDRSVSSPCSHSRRLSRSCTVHSRYFNKCSSSDAGTDVKKKQQKNTGFTELVVEKWKFNYFPWVNHLRAAEGLRGAPEYKGMAPPCRTNTFIGLNPHMKEVIKKRPRLINPLV